MNRIGSSGGKGIKEVGCNSMPDVEIGEAPVQGPQEAVLLGAAEIEGRGVIHRLAIGVGGA